MSDGRFRFFRQKPGQAPTLWSVRSDRSGTLQQFIADLRTRYDVEELEGGDYLVKDRN